MLLNHFGGIENPSRKMVAVWSHVSVFTFKHFFDRYHSFFANFIALVSVDKLKTRGGRQLPELATSIPVARFIHTHLNDTS